MQNNNFGLPVITIEKIRQYFKSIPDLKWVKLYGSRAMDTYSNGSDIDFAYSSYTTKDLTGKLLTELDELPTPYKFDVLNYDTLEHVNLKDHINRIGVMFYRNTREESC